MKDIIINLYKSFQLAADSFTAAGVKPIALIDRYRGQPLEVEAHEYYDLPAIFVSRQVQWQAQEGTWRGQLTLDFHIVAQTEGPTRSSADFPTALGYYDLIDQIKLVLDGFTTEYTSRLQRVSDREVDTGVTIYEILTYTCTVWDSTPEDTYVYSEDDDLSLRAGLVEVLK